MSAPSATLAPPPRGLASLRFRLPVLLLAYCAVIGVGLFVYASGRQEARFERDFVEEQLVRGTDLQSFAERAAERGELETAQRQFGEAAAFEEVRAAVFVGPDDRVVLSSRREWRDRALDLGALGLPPGEAAAVAEAMREARRVSRLQRVFSADRSLLTLVLPASLPPRPGALQLERQALIVLVFDLSFGKSVTRYRLEQQFAVAAGFLLVAALVLGIGLHFTVTRRLERLHRQMGRLAAGEAPESRAPRSHDEIAGIQRQFDTMAAAIRREMGEREQAEAQLRALGDNLPEGIIYQVVREADGTRRFVYVSGGVERLHGVTAAEVMADSSAVMGQFLPEDRPLVDAAIRGSEDTGGVFDVTVRVRVASGEVRWMHIRSAPRPLPDGRMIWDGIETDVTERVLADEALRDSEARLRSAMEHSGIGMALVGVDRRWIDVNPALCRILGYAREEMLSQTFQDVTHPDDRAESERLRQDALEGRLESFAVEKRYLHKDGHVVWVQLNSSIVRGGGAPYFVSQVQDITARKTADAELRRVNRALRTISFCNHALVHAANEADLLARVCRAIISYGGFRFTWVGLAGEAAAAGAPVSIAASLGHDEGYLDTLRAFWASGRPGPSRSVIESGTPFVCRDYETDPLVEPWRDQALSRGYRSSALLPLMTGGRVLGVLAIYSGEPHAFDEAEMRLLHELAEDLAYGIEAQRTRASREAAEAALRDSQSKLVLAMDMARLAPWEFSVDDRRFHLNDTFYALLATRAAEEGGDTLDEAAFTGRFLPAGEGEALFGPMAEVIASADPQATRLFEHRVARRDGSIGVLLVRLAAVRDGGRCVRVLGVSQDVTERKQGEEALRISEERFRAAMTHSPIGMALVGLDGRFAEVNPALCAIVGYRREELLQTRFQAITFPADLAADLDEVQRLLDHAIESSQVEKRYLHKRGYVVWVQQNVSIVRDERGQPRYFVQQVQSITERKRQAAEMLALNERYARHEAAMAALTRSRVQHPDQLPVVLGEITEIVARTLEVARVGVWTLDGSGAFVCGDLYQWPDGPHTSGIRLASEVCTSYAATLASADVIAATYPMRDPRTAAFAQAHLAPLGVTSVLDVPIRSQGAMVAVLCCEHLGEPRRWMPDEQTFVSAVANLLSSILGQVERQVLEEQLRQSQKLEGIGQLAGGVAHDFNNVLTVILGKAGQLAQDASVGPWARQAAAEIVQSGERAANLTRQLLAFSRRQAIEVKNVDLNQVVASLARMLDRILPENLRVCFAYAPAAAMVRADAGMIDQIVLNMAINARDAMPDGGQLEIETSIVEVDAATAARGGHEPGPYVCLRIADTGTGISPEHLPRIFEPFFTTKDVGKGTGLGLATTYGVVQQHGGWIDVATEVGAGTTFRVYLPRVDAATPVDGVAAEPDEESLARGGAETLLVVEDEDAVRGLIVDALGAFGYTVLEAPSGPRALEVWRAHGRAIDLLVTDMVMPDGMNGLDLAARMTAEHPGLRVVYMSGYLADVEREQLRESVGVAYLAKPFSLPSLARLVRATLDGATKTATHQQS